MKLEYGMILCDSEYKNRYVVKKYWDDDTDPMAYKVKLVQENDPENRSSFYSSDLRSLIEEKKFTVELTIPEDFVKVSDDLYWELVDHKNHKVDDRTPYTVNGEKAVHSFDVSRITNVRIGVRVYNHLVEGKYVHKSLLENYTKA